MAVYNLPPVSKDALTEPTLSGDWFTIPSLDALARSLRLDKTPVRLDELKSIPDAWAQAQLTSDAFFDEDHDAHEHVVVQWRALLAMLALQPRNKSEYDLKISTLDLKADAAASRLRKVLTALKPMPSTSLGLSWDRFGVIHLIDRAAGEATDQAVAFLSPDILVAPGRMASRVSLSGISWLKNGLADPVETQGLSVEEWNILSGYLEGLIAKVRELVGAPITDLRRDALVGQLQSYFNAVKPFAQSGLPTRKHELALEWPEPFYRNLGSTQIVDAENIQSAGSECEIRCRKGRISELYQGIILVDPEIADTLGRNPQDIRVWKHLTLRDAMSSATLKKIKAEALAEGFLVIEKDELFTQKLARLEDGAEIPGNPTSAQHELLPVSPLSLLLLGSPDEWNSSAELVAKRSDITFAITLELKNSNTRHKARKNFSGQDILKIAPPNDLAIWPNFESADWPWTFLRFQYNPKNDLITRFAISGEIIAAHVRDADPRKQTKKLSEWSDSENLIIDRLLQDSSVSRLEDSEGHQLLERFRFVDTPQLIGEQHQLPHGAEAIFFAINDEATGRKIPAGCILIKRQQALHSTDNATVAFDFGTTNTVAYSKRGTQPSMPLTFEDRVLLPIKTQDGKEAVAPAYTDFFPVKPHQTPLPTIAKKREFGNGPLPTEIREQLNEGSDVFGLSHMVFFMPRGGNTDSPTFLIGLINSGLLEFNIKWGEDVENRRLVKSFLKQLMIMVAAELHAGGVLIEKIQWRYSFPQAFTFRQKSAFQKIIKSAWKSLSQDNVVLDQADANIAFTTESEAAMRYFTKDEAQERRGVGRLVIMFDIGGGTTDIAIWKVNGLLWKGSARLAGSHFFNGYLRNNMQVLADIDKEAVQAFEASRTSSSANMDDKYRSTQFVELFVAKRDFSKRFEAQYPMHSGEADWAGLRQCAVTALGGLHYYVGYVLHELKRTGAIDDTDLSELTIALGGRGSSIFRHLVSGTDTAELASICKIVGMGSAEITPPKHVHPRFSALPKEEVARGLLLDPDQVPSTQELFVFNPSGLSVVFQGEHGDGKITDRDDIDSISSAQDVKEVSLDGLNAFLGNLGDASGLHINLIGSEAERIVQQRTRAHLKERIARVSNNQESSADTQLLEAPFITALRNLIEILAGETHERTQKVTVREAQ